MDRFHAMRVFAKVIEEGSFASAARAVAVSPAVVTRLMAELEDHLGVRLMHRTTRRLALTDAGEQYLERVRAILLEVDDAEAMATSASTEPRGIVRVLVPPALAVHQIAPLLPAFRARHPQVGFELSSPGPVHTVDDNFDLSILLVEGPLEGEFVARLLARTAWIACASPAYLARKGRPANPEALNQHQVITPPGLREVDLRSADGARVVLPVRRTVLTTHHIDTQYAAALAGLGIAGLPSFLVHHALKAGTLERVLPDWRLLTGTVYAAMPTRKHVPARTRAFLDFLVERLGGEDRDPWLASRERLPPVR